MRWIETQDVILSRTEGERIIEVGPSATLLGMFRKTIDTIYPTQECALPAPRQLLHSEKNTDDIYYSGKPEKIESSKTQAQAQTTTQSQNVVPTSAESAPKVTVEVTTTALPTPRVHVEVVSIEDQDVQARDIVFAIVSRALKRAASEIDGSKSIKALAEG